MKINFIKPAKNYKNELTMLVSSSGTIGFYRKKTIEQIGLSKSPYVRIGTNEKGEIIMQFVDKADEYTFNIIKQGNCFVFSKTNAKPFLELLKFKGQKMKFVLKEKDNGYILIKQ